MALEKPFIHSLTAQGTPDPVNFNDIFSFEKVKEISTGISPKMYFIVFKRDENTSAPKEIIWKYVKECDRDAEYDLILSMISKPVQ